MTARAPPNDLRVASYTMRYSVAASLAASSAGAASFFGANQLKTSSTDPLKVHSAAAAVVSFLGLAGFGMTPSAPDAARLADAPNSSDAARLPEAPESSNAARFPDASEARAAEAANAAEAERMPGALRDARAPDAAEAADAAAAADATSASDAATSAAVCTCSMEPSTTTREPPIPAPVCAIFSVSDVVSASLLRINCSHASEFLYTVVHATSSAPVVATQAIERIRIFIDVPLFRPSAIVAYEVPYSPSRCSMPQPGVTAKGRHFHALTVMRHMGIVLTARLARR
ncbi:MAG TPA: hypothetical protein VFE79_04170 [Paraburkholderia sp.]|nr:hypothetical protein [Paraburkholderia sp.]